MGSTVRPKSNRLSDNNKFRKTRVGKAPQKAQSVYVAGIHPHPNPNISSQWRLDVGSEESNSLLRAQLGEKV